MAVEVALAVTVLDRHAEALRIPLERLDDGRRYDVVVEIDVHFCPTA
jgi:hypothetical protein